MYKKTKLSNGLRVLTMPSSQVQSVSALVMVEAGSRYETKKINGLSHFLEHMAFKGTKKRPNKLAISSLLDGIGASFNAFTNKEYTGFYIKAESRHLELALDILSDMLTNSLFDAKEVDKERGVITEEINMYEDLPQERVSEIFEKLLYGDQPLAWQILGSKENIRDVTRKELVDYAGRLYHSEALVAGLAGYLPENTMELVKKYFDAVPKGGENQYEKIKESQKVPASSIYYKKTDQAHLCVGVRAYDMNHPDRYVLSVLGTILGGNMSSRMWAEVREKRGLAYYVASDNTEYHDTGYLVTQAGVKIPSVGDAIKVILEQYHKMTSQIVSREELRRAKDFARGRMVLALEDSYRVASYYTGQELLRQEIETPEEALEKIEKVTKEDIQRVAKDIFVDQKLNLAVIGPFEDKKKFDSLLKL